jgi:hypothetical protein
VKEEIPITKGGSKNLPVFDESERRIHLVSPDRIVARRPYIIRHISESVKLAALADYKSGLSLQRVADEHGIGRRSVCDIVQLHGAQRHKDRRTRQRYPLGKIDQIKAALLGGVLRSKICKKYHTNYRWLAAHFGEAPKPKALQFEKYKHIVASLRKRGLSQGEIARRIGKEWTFVRYVLRRQGMTQSYRFSDGRVAQIRELYAGGLSSVKIAERLGVDKRSVLFYLKDLLRPRHQRGRDAKLRRRLSLKLASAHKSDFTSLKTQDLIDIYNTQKGRCALTNVLMSAESSSQDSVSIDRIDGSKGYVLGNVRLTTRFANLARSGLGDKAFHEFMQKLLRDYVPPNRPHEVAPV